MAETGAKLNDGCWLGNIGAYELVRGPGESSDVLQGRNMRGTVQWGVDSPQLGDGVFGKWRA